jgi:hypothetical protein
MLNVIILKAFMLSVIMQCQYAECRNAESCYAECRHAVFCNAKCC